MKKGEYWGHEVYFPESRPLQDTIDKLEKRGFDRSDDGFYIHREKLALFITVAAPHRVAILQHNILLRDGEPAANNWNKVINQIFRRNE